MEPSTLQNVGPGASIFKSRAVVGLRTVSNVCWRMMYGGRFGEPKISADMHLKVRYGAKLSEKGSYVDEPESASVSWGAGDYSLRMSASRGEPFGWQ